MAVSVKLFPPMFIRILLIITFTLTLFRFPAP